jgi:hypothetical protein
MIRMTRDAIVIEGDHLIDERDRDREEGER